MDTSWLFIDWDRKRLLSWVRRLRLRFYSMGSSTPLTYGWFIRRNLQPSNFQRRALMSGLPTLVDQNIAGATLCMTLTLTQSFGTSHSWRWPCSICQLWLIISKTRLAKRSWPTFRIQWEPQSDMLPLEPTRITSTRNSICLFSYHQSLS